jgi:hypothetical protein
MFGCTRITMMDCNGGPPPLVTPVLQTLPTYVRYRGGRTPWCTAESSRMTQQRHLPA